MIALKPTTKGADFDLCDLRIAVIQFEGTVQICFLADGWQGGPRKVLSNCFVDAATPDQLRYIAAYLDGLALPAPEGAI
jgi:hypothetical protein